jgi:hypothetical protein
MLKTLSLSAAALFALGVAVAGCDVVVHREFAPTIAQPVAALDLPDDFVPATAPVAVVAYDLPADYVAPSASTYDAAALDVPAPITVEA